MQPVNRLIARGILPSRDGDGAVVPNLHNARLNRRSFLVIAGSLAALDSDARAASIPIIDTHIHLFDTRRPDGVPWPDKKDTILYKPALPERFSKIAAPLGVAGAIVIEASPRLEDNQWVLNVAAKNTVIVGTVGNLEPGKPDFARHM